MAIVNGLFGKMRGKYGGGVYAIVKGQNILREYNPQPGNPRSYAQQAQRALLANMVKFYKRGTQNFYKFAFEDKTSRESDYNAFARHNMQQGVYFEKALFDNPATPALGNYVLTKGSISHSLKIKTVGDSVVLVATFSSELTTIGQFSAWILANQPNIQAGDIFTLVRAESDLAPGNVLLGTTPPSWDTIQFFIDPTSTETLQSVGLKVYPNEVTETEFRIGFDMNAVDRASFAALTISRNTPDGLKVSNTEMALSPAASILTDWNRGDYAVRQTAISWGGNPEAFLQGGQLRTLPELTGVTIANVQNTPYAYGLGKFGGGGAQILIGGALTGSSLKTTAQGGVYTLRFYDATLYEPGETPPDLLKSVVDVPLTATGTATSISLSGSVTVADTSYGSDTQAFGLLYLDGVPVWWGLLTYQAG